MHKYRIELNNCVRIACDLRAARVCVWLRTSACPGGYVFFWFLRVASASCVLLTLSPWCDLHLVALANHRLCLCHVVIVYIMAPKRTTRSKKASAASLKSLQSTKQRKSATPTVAKNVKDVTPDQPHEPTRVTTPPSSCTASALSAQGTKPARSTVIVRADIHPTPIEAGLDASETDHINIAESSDNEQPILVEVPITPPPVLKKKSDLETLTETLTGSSKRRQQDIIKEGTEWEEDEENELIEMWKAHDFLYMPEKQVMNSRVNKKFTIQHFARQLSRTGE